MPADASPPATKRDIQLLMEEMAKLYQRIADWESSLRGEIADVRKEMNEWKVEIIHEFKIVAEDMRHDFKGAFSDKLSQHDDALRNHDRRITRLERGGRRMAAA